MAAVTISGITGFVSSLRRRIGDPSAVTYSDASLTTYLSDGFDYIEQFLALGYTTSITGTTYYVDPSPDVTGKVASLSAAEYLVKQDKLWQIIDNSIYAKDGAQTIDTSKSVGVAQKAAEDAYDRLMDFIDETKYVLITASGGGYVINTLSHIEIDSDDDGSAF